MAKDAMKTDPETLLGREATVESLNCKLAKLDEELWKYYTTNGSEVHFWWLEQMFEDSGQWKRAPSSEDQHCKRNL